MRGLIAILALAAGIAASCADGRRDEGVPDLPVRSAPQPPGDAAAVPDQAVSVDDAPTPVEWTAGDTRIEHSIAGTAVQTEVRAARNEGFDRVVLEFAGDELPSYAIEYIDRPVRQCGSGHVVPMAGDGWLSIRLEPARAHDEEGRATIEDRELRTDLPILLELTITCDFEAHVEWVLGVASPNRYRVMELREPTRLVVDVRH
jgi:hypothetical protein